LITQRPAHALLHRIGVAGMPAAGDIGGADQGQQQFIVITTFTEVGVQIDMH